MHLQITIDTGNAAFADDNTETEVMCILHRLGERIERSGLEEEIPLFDHNGNMVGMVTYTENDGPADMLVSLKELCELPNKKRPQRVWDAALDAIDNATP